ncbi:inorganic phosphate transporter (plasmid) [Rhizobium leguminosarum bv. trifolii]|nr:inorganic phosphate transporter [Rhizobium leguminosarum bv. trifolii]
MAGDFHVPLLVVLSCQSAIALGTLFGGWRMVHAMGSKITRLNPMQAFGAETGGALTLVGATWLGIPVSTTHTITAGGLAGNIVVAWVVTLPVAAIISALDYWLSDLFH